MSDRPAVIRAPWSDEEVAGLARHQASGWLHPYTCGGCRAVLVPTSGGWVCPACPYRQDWAHALSASLCPSMIDGDRGGTGAG